MIDFVGPARALGTEDVRTIAGYLGCHVAAVRAVLAIEAAGNGFGPDKRPIILNEPHHFYRQIGPGPKRNEAVRRGLAYQAWGAKPYPRTQAARYAWLADAMGIDEAAALKSCSWGMGQVMGFNHQAAGFNTVQDFVRAMTISEGAQLYAMARFIVTNDLQLALRRLDWRAFARGYNGAAYEKNAYHTKLAAAYQRRPAAERVTPPPASAADLNAMVAMLAPPVPAPKPVPAPAPIAPQPDDPGPTVAENATTAPGWLARFFLWLSGRSA